MLETLLSALVLIWYKVFLLLYLSLSCNISNIILLSPLYQKVLKVTKFTRNISIAICILSTPLLLLKLNTVRTTSRVCRVLQTFITFRKFWVYINWLSISNTYYYIQRLRVKLPKKPYIGFIQENSIEFLVQNVYLIYTS